MGIYVKGMTMPKHCFECPCFNDNEFGDCFCNLDDERRDVYVGRPEWCPLVELPEKHGRLVEFVDVATTTDEDTGTETVNLGEAFAAYFKMRESKPVIEAEGEG